MGYVMGLFRKKYYRKGIIAIIYRLKDSKREYLVLDRVYPYRGWSLLKGSLEGRPEREALEKELLEEAHLESPNILNIQKIPKLKVKYKFPRSPRSKEYVCIGQDMQAYAVEVDPEAVVRPDFKEHGDYAWAELPQAKRMLRFGQHKKALKVADKFIRKLIKTK